MLLGVILWTGVLALIIYVISLLAFEKDNAKISGDMQRFFSYQVLIVLLMFALAITYLQIILNVVAVTTGE